MVKTSCESANKLGGGNTMWKNTAKQPVCPKSQWPKYEWTCSQLKNALPDKDIYFIHPCLFFCIDFLETKMLLAGLWHRNFSFINIYWKNKHIYQISDWFGNRTWWPRWQCMRSDFLNDFELFVPFIIDIFLLFEDPIFDILDINT